MSRYEELGEELAPLDYVCSRAVGEFAAFLDWAGSERVAANQVILWVGGRDLDEIRRISRMELARTDPVPQSLRRFLLVGARKRTAEITFSDACFVRRERRSTWNIVDLIPRGTVAIPSLICSTWNICASLFSVIVSVEIFSQLPSVPRETSCICHMRFAKFSPTGGSVWRELSRSRIKRAESERPPRQLTWLPAWLPPNSPPCSSIATLRPMPLRPSAFRKIPPAEPSTTR